MRKSEENLIDVDVGEILKPIQGYENKYLISSYGRVWSIRSKKWLKYSVPSNGYAQVGLSLNNKRTSYMIHRLVAKTFLQKPTNKDYVNHIDGNKLNNRVNNLEWVTRSDNEKHAFANKLKIPTRGELSGQSKLTWEQVKIIRQMYNKQHYSTRHIAKIFNVGKSTIQSITSNHTWKEEE